jgi:hypothetical protein
VTRPTTFIVVIVVSVLASALPVQAQPTATASDGDDVAGRLDIRFATLSAESGDRSRITLTFWNRVPPRLLERHSIRMEVSYSNDRPVGPGGQVIAFFRNGDGFIRMVWGLAASECCFVAAGQHPDDFTYTGVLPFSIDEAATWLRGVATRRHTCERGERRACVLFQGRVADRTRWVAI